MKTLLLRSILALLCVFSIYNAIGQLNNQGTIRYDRTTNWIKIQDKLTYLTQEEKDRMRLTWGRSEDWSQQMELSFDTSKSLYKYAEFQKNMSGGYSWKQDELFLLRDRTDRKVTDIRELPDKTYLISDDLPETKWKILTSIKEIAGYICMNAETRDTVKNQRIEAWFTTEIPLPIGPEGYGGLPGAILELIVDDEAVVITATEVTFHAHDKPLTLPKRKKLRTLTILEYNKKMREYLKDSIAAKRNPYWSMRY